MGWSITIKVKREQDWTKDELQWIAAHRTRWDTLSRLSEGYPLRQVAAGALWCSSKQAPSSRSANDAVKLVLAARELEEHFPDATVRISTDMDATEEVPKQVDVEKLRRRLLREWKDPDGVFADSPEGDEEEELELLTILPRLTGAELVKALQLRRQDREKSEAKQYLN